MKRKILVTTGTRAEYGILRPLLKKINDSKKLELLLVVTGTHLSKKYGNTINNIKSDGFKISATIEMIPKSDDNFSMAIELGHGIISFAKCFKKLKPDINIILGDRDEMLASALAASHMNIINAHIHGGDLSGGLDEYIRHAITKISNIHFAATKNSKQRIIKMGENKNNVFFTGSPSIDEIKHNKIPSLNQLEKKYNITFTGKEIILVQHPVTTQTHLTQFQINAILKALKKINNTIIAIAPNSDAGNNIIFKTLTQFSKTYPKFYLYSSIPREDYLGFLKNAGVLVGNSSSGFIEGSYFDIPVINIGIRQKNRQGGKNIINITEFSSKKIFNEVISVLQHPRRNTYQEKIYGNGNSSKKIVSILEKISLDEKLINKEFVD